MISSRPPLLFFLFLPLILAACTFPRLPRRASATSLPAPSITPQPSFTITASFTATAQPATMTSSPFPSATSTLPLTTTTSVPSPTASFIPTPTGLPLLRYPLNELVLALTWSPDGKMLAVAAGESVHLVDGSTLAELRALPVGAWAGSLAFEPGGKLLALAAKDGTLQLWQPETGQLVCKLEAHHPSAKSVAFSPDGRWLASTGNDAYVRLWDVANLPQEGECNLAPSAELIGGALSVPSAVFSPDGTILTSVDAQVIRLREVSSQRLVRSIPVDTAVFCLAYSPDGSLLASGDLGNGVRLWDPSSGQALRDLRLGGPLGAFVWSVAFSPDGKWLVAGSSDASVSLWDPATGQLLHTFTGQARDVTSVAFSPDGRWLASGSLDATVRVWPLDLP